MSASRKQFSASSRNSATAATATHAGFGLWNSGTGQIFLKEIWATKTTAIADVPCLIRNTTRGTPASTTTPTSANGADVWPDTPLGLLDNGPYSAQPTIGAIYMVRDTIAGAIGAGFKWIFPRPIEIIGSTGVVVVTPSNLALQPYDFTFIWEE